ncbi:alkaline phosphatase D [Streptomyces sp. Amel2xB2]|uniref:alkaline phosphatase D family protein n=1 Tax=Streptomyces sp. Amel2xB2 TaxID=1305829 RepID=UPI000DB93200|nr:alkaline phosphatase D family protein [Streptomyces sp. Amel2xB2]RAJ58270.1 alkaline phosphatase D [Streptomyces sp. Amel2xB2]
MTQPSSADSEYRAAARRLCRRRLLTGTAAAVTLALGIDLPRPAHAAAKLDPARIDKDPFTLGVASGDPRPDSVVLWTRLAPEPYEPDGGLPREPVAVRWELARDKGFTRDVRSGETTAHPEFNHAVHVVPEGLSPRTGYYYRFRTGIWTSTVGRTRTAPSAADASGSLRFAAVSCQAYHDGYFTALGHLAREEDVDAVLHLGDYLYEYAVDAHGGDRADPTLQLPDRFNKETVTLEDYRLRYALYHRDPDLQAAHAAHPWIVTWDDHEVENNYADETPEGSPPEAFLARRAAAYRAYYENLPLRPPQQPSGSSLQLYRRLQFGRLAQLDILDGRQHRDDQSAGDGWKVPTDETTRPDRTMLGTAQERWLADGWESSRAVWNVVPQQTVLSRRRNRTSGPYPLSMDAWDGYPAARGRFLDAARKAGVTNLAVLTGDVHVHYAMDIKEDFDDTGSRTAGVELVTTSVASGGDGVAEPGDWQTLRDANPHMKFYDGRRGYVLLTLDQRQLRADYRTVDRVTRPGAPVSTAASFVSRAGDPGLKEL